MSSNGFVNATTLAAVNPDKAPAKARNKSYPHSILYLYACVIFAIMCVQWSTWAWNKLSAAKRLRNVRSKASTTTARADPELGSSSGSGVPASTSRPISIRYFPTYTTSAIRTLLFRKTITMTIPMISFSGPPYVVQDQYMLNVSEILLTIGYTLALFTWEFVNTTSIAGVPLLNRYWSDRAGTLMAAQMPLITAFGTKNLISGTLRISTEKVNYLHRMTSRVVFVMLWVHVAGRVQATVDAADSASRWLHLGILAGVCFFFLIIFSLKPIRKAAYELFFLTHFILALVLLIGAFFHTRNFGFQQYIWPCFVIWGLDRVIRLARVVSFNFSHYFAPPATLFSPSSSSSSLTAKDTSRIQTHARIRMLSTHCIQVIIPRPYHFHWSPGQTAILTIPSLYHVPGIPLEAHPFTIASFDSSIYAHDNADGTSSSVDNHKSKKEKDLEGSQNRDPFSNDIVFLINAHKGFTHRLALAASANTEPNTSTPGSPDGGDNNVKDIDVKVFVDGPYGITPDITFCDTVILIAGGSGISYTLPVFLDIVERIKRGKTNCTKVVFIWAIRSVEHITWISSPIFQSLSKFSSSLGVTIDVRIHITKDHNVNPDNDWDDDSVHGSDELEDEKPRASDETELASPTSPTDTVIERTNVPLTNKKSNTPKAQKRSSSSKSLRKEMLSLSCVSTTPGRPDLNAILKEEVDGTASGGHVSVHVCGSIGIARAVRSALSYNPTNILRGGASVSLHVESFGIA